MKPVGLSPRPPRLRVTLAFPLRSLRLCVSLAFLLLSLLSSAQSPFSFRMVFYGPATDSAYAVEHRIRQVIKTRDSEDPEWGLWVHTMHRFVPLKQFETHPEYFAERNSTRVPDQLCLSNPEVLRITVDSLRAMMARKPAARYWSVSQMDNYNHCQCAQCHHTDSIEGSPSGTILRFANAVADSFPDKVISTLAYQYSRKAPKVTKPRPNVNIMLCSIEEDRSRPIATRDEPGSFTADLREWSSLTKNIIVWDYVINFSHLLAPFPNWKVLQPNLRLFRDAGVPMIFEQGLSSPGGEMPEFRCYLLAKLLWDPDLNIDSLRTHFMDSYYGDAGAYIDKYTRLLEEELDRSGRALTLYEHPQTHKDGYLSPENIAKYKALFDEAEQRLGFWLVEEGVDVNMYQARLEVARLPIMYAELEVARAMPGTDHGLFEKNDEGKWVAKDYFITLLDTFITRAERAGNIQMHETSNALNDYYFEFERYLRDGVVENLASGHPIIFDAPPAAQYSGGRSDALTDGFLASTNYQYGWQGWWGTDMVATIDLGEVRRVESVDATFLQDQKSWIFLPSEWGWESSEDGEHWTPRNRTLMEHAATKGEMDIIWIGLPTPPWIMARYIRVTAKNLGDLPAWHGSNGRCWLFCDEIVVR